MEISVEPVATSQYREMGRASGFSTKQAVARDTPRSTSAAEVADVVTPDEVVAEVARIVDIVMSWPPERQVPPPH